LVAFYSKHNRLSLSLFAVNPVAIVADPYLKVNLFVFAVNNGGHLRRHEELLQLRGLRSSLFLLGEKMITQRFDDARVALPEPFSFSAV
jgi:hypothetical protein